MAEELKETLRVTLYLFSGFAPTGGGSGLQSEYSTQQGERLVLGKADVCVVVQAEDLWRVVNRQAADVRKIALQIIHYNPQVIRSQNGGLGKPLLTI